MIGKKLRKHSITINGEKIMKFIRVDMTDGTVAVEDVPAEYQGLGGRGLTSIMINREVPPDCDPLGPDNKLIVAPGILSGTPLVNTSRISIGAKSPLTGGIKESNAGGTVGAALGKMGVKAIVVTGAAPKGALYVLRVDAEGGVSLDPADTCRGMRTYALVTKLRDTYGQKNGVMCIGPAGEFKLASASIQTSDVDGRPCRAAGRGGMGAVMGAKGLKAIVVDTRARVAERVAEPDDFKDAVKVFADAVKKNPFSGKTLREVGTAGLVGAVNSVGGFPCYNATRGVMDGWEKITGEAMAATIKRRGGKASHMGCSQCIIHCSNEYVDETGAYMTSSLEYETIWSMGGMTGISDLDTIARLDYLADDIGLDTMNTGVAMGVAMDAGYRPFGDSRAALEMMAEIAAGTEFGRILGNGPAAVGKHLNHARVPVVKKQSIAAYDPRAMPANGVTYATSPMGADHTCGNLVGSYLAGMLDHGDSQAQIHASRQAQVGMAALDCTGMCLLAGGAISGKAGEAFYRMIAMRLGRPFGAQDYMALGRQVLEAEMAFNRKAGFTNADDRLPVFFYEEKLSPNDQVFPISAEDLDSTFTP
jgi:aldehyde:ferredoxin oxidoreductase